MIISNRYRTAIGSLKSIAAAAITAPGCSLEGVTVAARFGMSR